MLASCYFPFSEVMGWGCHDTGGLSEESGGSSSRPGSLCVPLSAIGKALCRVLRGSDRTDEVPALMEPPRLGAGRGKEYQMMSALKETSRAL